MKKNDEGFTLIELLIVIVILGILATVVVFAVGGITDKGKTSACKAELKDGGMPELTAKHLKAHPARVLAPPPAP